MWSLQLVKIDMPFLDYDELQYTYVRRWMVSIDIINNEI